MAYRIWLIVVPTVWFFALSPVLGAEIGTESDFDIDENTRSLAGQRVGRAGFGFLKIGQGARPVGMGEAFVAVADDINAAFWNPAGLTEVERLEYLFTYSEWIAGSMVMSGATAMRTRYGVVGLSFISHQPPATEETTILEPQGTGEMMNIGDIAVGFLYAKQLTNKLSFGVHFRWIQESLHLENLQTVDMSVGTHFDTGFKSVRIAMSFQNFGKDLTPVDRAFPMPAVFNFAGAMEAYGNRGDPVWLTIASNFNFPIDYEERLVVGGELWLMNTLALRGGYKFNTDVEGYTLGVGMKWGRDNGRHIAVDFAYSQFDLFDAPLRFSVNGSF